MDDIVLLFKQNFQWIFSGIGVHLLKLFVPLKGLCMWIFVNYKGVIVGVLLSTIAFCFYLYIAPKSDSSKAPHPTVTPTNIEDQRDSLPITTSSLGIINDQNISSIDSKKIHDAFETLFGSRWLVQPYADRNIEKKNCYDYQGKWELDKTTDSGKVPYFFKFPYRGRFIYYVAHSVSAYAWCQRSGDNKGKKESQEAIDKLEMIELLTNRIYLSKDNKELNTENYEVFKEQSFLVGKIGGLFIDHFDFSRDSLGKRCSKKSGEPCTRIGTRIGRYNLKVSEPENKIPDFSKDEIIIEASRHVQNLKPTCSVTMEDKLHLADEKAKSGTKFNLIAGKSVMRMDCVALDEVENENLTYSKKLIFKKEWHDTNK